MLSAHPIDRLAVRVPASTSNLGCGFDCLGLAVALWIEVRATRVGSARAADPLDDEARELPAGWPSSAEDDLLHAAFRRSAGPAAEGFRLTARSSIPIGRGLGSSGAAVAAGLLLGRAVARSDASPGDGSDRTDLVAAGCELEGHPDNVTASLLGGCTVCVPRASEPPLVTRVPLHGDLLFAVAWPREPLATSRARAALPASVPFPDAVENARRAALLVRGLETGDPELLRAGLDDRLHVRHRLPLLPGAAEALAAARAVGAIGATLSGAGSGLVALCTGPEADAVAEALRNTLDRQGAGPAQARVLEPVLDPPQVVYLP